MAFGAGVLISSVSYELVEEAFNTSTGGVGVGLGLATGAGVFYVGDALLDRFGASGRKSSAGKQAGGSALAIVLGIILDGIPESAVLGLTVLQAGSVSVAFLAAVLLSNLPEAIAATSRLARRGGEAAASSACGHWCDRLRPGLAGRHALLDCATRARWPSSWRSPAGRSSRCSPTR